jgi:hypothetical protein
MISEIVRWRRAWPEASILVDLRDKTKSDICLELANVLFAGQGEQTSIAVIDRTEAPTIVEALQRATPRKMFQMQADLIKISELASLSTCDTSIVGRLRALPGSPVARG